MFMFQGNQSKTEKIWETWLLVFFALNENLEELNGQMIPIYCTQMSFYNFQSYDEQTGPNHFLWKSSFFKDCNVLLSLL